MADTRRDWLTLHLVPGLGATGFRRLVETFGSASSVFKVSQKDLLQVPGLRADAIAAIVNHPPYQEADVELKQADRLGVALLSFGEPDYPALLANIYKPPMVLYVKGDPGVLKQEGLAVVGSRAATSYGLKIARELSGKLAAKGLVIFSGLALGIDTAAHAGTLAVGGRTVAVLGCGLDVCYPASNWRLAEQIIETGGALVSEYRLGTKPDAFRFPERNRIISGLGRGVLVVEAAQRSGSLITARLALEEGREVFAIPGRVDSTKSAGAHRLLQEGAKLVGGIDDILDEMGWLTAGSACEMATSSKLAPAEPIGQDEAQVLAVLEVYPKHIDSIIAQAKLTAAKVNEVLLRLELNGLIESLPGQQYRAIT
ncbi:MAG: DNA-processing protein DprA [Proteobacteria bacterium]|nr:DNA-protecting protein DprA [Desulfobulbaceae bacterium]MBU4151891.1 DNA-processing protein DprA [Pseudomonadota bacterium]MDP2106307.1 DNA-processing protein DprA [Desulfobulbaceae bacterium]